ncbi:uncharacterized protein LOC135475709 [Liolophura sinensis]|uniref:uncharacterized protein LOC135475709 n=1 Tax=Liolophura sinensis TaxID=3198878 RepID=UPI0031587CC0
MAVLVIVNGGFGQYVIVVVVVGNYQDPDCVWPLTEESYGTETKSGTYNALLSNCVFDHGPSALGSTQSLSVDATTVIEINNGGDYFGTDFMVSAFFFSTSSSVTLFHYVDSGRNDVFKVWSTSSHLHVEVFGAGGTGSLGSVSESYSLPTNQWLQLGFLREKSNGVIKVFVDTEKVIDIDEDFDDYVSLPNGGNLRVGNPFSNAMSPFVGRIACIQIYTALISEGEMDSTVLNNCKKGRWIAAVPTTASQTCASNLPTTQGSVPAAESLTSVMTTTLTPVQSQTESLMQEMNANQPLNGYFLLRMRNSIPSEVGSLITWTRTKGIFGCGSKCLISPQCLSFSISKLNSFEKNCSLYDYEADLFIERSGFTYYTRIDKK